MNRITDKRVYGLLATIQKQYPRLNLKRNGGQYGNYWFAVAMEPNSSRFKQISGYFTTREMYTWLEGFTGHKVFEEKSSATHIQGSTEPLKRIGDTK